MIVLPTPAPCRVIALVIVIPVDHVNVPAGIVIVSPFWACVSWICWIFCGVPSEFQTAAAQRGPEKPLKIRINRRIPDSFIIAAYRSLRLAARLHIRMESAWQENFFCRGHFLQAQVSESLGQRARIFARHSRVLTATTNQIMCFTTGGTLRGPGPESLPARRRNARHQNTTRRSVVIPKPDVLIVHGLGVRHARVCLSD